MIIYRQVKALTYLNGRWTEQWLNKEKLKGLREDLLKCIRREYHVKSSVSKPNLRSEKSASNFNEILYTENGVVASLPSVVCLYSSTFVYAVNEPEAREIYAR
jgi:hypothetical protein